jgi:hypothetical protein
MPLGLIRRPWGLGRPLRAWRLRRLPWYRRAARAEVPEMVAQQRRML